MTAATLPEPPSFDSVPVIVAPKAAIRADAKNRAIRTFVQGVFIDVLIAVGATAYTILTGDDFTWAALGLAAGKTALTTLASYVMRIKLNGRLMMESKDNEPIVVNVGGYELELQRPGKADHAAA